MKVVTVVGARPFPISLEEGTANLEVGERIAACYAASHAPGTSVSGSSLVKGY
ncbi:MAG: hypothetical protein ABFC38_14800 [Methanospirillum sp.]